MTTLASVSGSLPRRRILAEQAAAELADASADKVIGWAVDRCTTSLPSRGPGKPLAHEGFPSISCATCTIGVKPAQIRAADAGRGPARPKAVSIPEVLAAIAVGSTDA